nr:ADP ribosylation factor binding protein GGA1 [Hymenolepis microstoma]
MASASGTQSLEDMITEITSPLTTHMDLNAFKKIYDRINIDPHGPELALRLLAHKIQSPVEKEALSALVILDLCVQNCGPSFHRELGKYKFLNEMMKVLLPKHLGLTTPPSVRERCIMLMFVWQRDFGDKYPKLKEAYQALKAQNIITDDPVIQDDSERNRERMANRTDIFGNSRYKDKLARLLKSKNPEDFREANAIIKSIVNEENARVEKRSRRALELETLRSNTSLLEEMLRCFDPSVPSSSSDKDVMEEIVANIKQARPTIFELALSDDDRVEGFLTDVIETCSRASSVLERYEVVVLHKPPSTVEDPAIFSAAKHENRQPPSQLTSNTTADDLIIMPPNANHDLLQQDLLNLGIGDSLPPRNQSPSLLDSPKTTAQSNVDLLDKLLSNSPKDQTSDHFKFLSPSQPPQSFQNIAPTYTQNSNAPPSTNIASSKNSISEPSSKKSATNIFSELDMVGRMVFGLPTPETDSVGALKANSSSGSLNSRVSAMSATIPEPAKQPPSETVAQQQASIELPSLSSLPAINTSEIQPHRDYNKPIRVLPVEGAIDGEEHGSVEFMLHCTANKPHPSVVVFIAVITNRSALPVTNLLLRFGVEKPLKVRQLALSSSHLPAFCSFLPPSPAQQTIYVQRPPTFETKLAKLKFQLSFTIDEEDVLESGVVTVPLD